MIYINVTNTLKKNIKDLYYNKQEISVEIILNVFFYLSIHISCLLIGILKIICERALMLFLPSEAITEIYL